MHSDSLFFCGFIWQIGWRMVWIGAGGEYPVFGVQPGAQVYQFAAPRAEWERPHLSRLCCHGFNDLAANWTPGLHVGILACLLRQTLQTGRPQGFLELNRGAWGLLRDLTYRNDYALLALANLPTNRKRTLASVLILGTHLLLCLWRPLFCFYSTAFLKHSCILNTVPGPGLSF